MGNDIDTNSLLLARGVGGYGAGFGYGGYGAGVGGFANPSANAIRLDRNDQRNEDQADCTRMAMGLGLDRISDQAEEGRRSAQFTTLVDATNHNTNRLTDRMSEAALTGAINDGNTRVENVRSLADIRAEMAACCCDTKLEILKQSKEAALCCCETQKLIITENTATRELINARALDDAHRALDTAVARNTSADTVSALVGAMQNQTATLINALSHGRCA